MDLICTKACLQMMLKQPNWLFSLECLPYWTHILAVHNIHWTFAESLCIGLCLFIYWCCFECRLSCWNNRLGLEILIKDIKVYKLTHVASWYLYECIRIYHLKSKRLGNLFALTHSYFQNTAGDSVLSVIRGWLNTALETRQ